MARKYYHNVFRKLFLVCCSTFLLCQQLYGDSILGLEWDSQAYFTRSVLTLDSPDANLKYTVVNHVAESSFFYIDVYNITTPYLHRVIDISDKSILKIDAIPYLEYGVIRLVYYVRNNQTTIDIKTVANPTRLVVDVVLPHSDDPVVGMPIGKNQTYFIKIQDNKAMQDAYIGNSGQKEYTLPDLPRLQIDRLRNSRFQSGKKKVVIIDAGHGGHDSGAQGMLNGRVIREKDLTLQFAYALKKSIDSTQNMIGILSRIDDSYWTLSDRVKFAEEKHADLFISIHINHADNSDARGMEVFFLNERGTAQSNLELERKENQEVGDLNFFNMQRTGILNKILSDIRKSNLESLQWESFEVCKQVILSLRNIPFYKLNNRGIKSANFYVLKNKEMPAVLLEVAFISNSDDLSSMINPRFQAMTARNLSIAIQNYFAQTEKVGIKGN